MLRIGGTPAYWILRRMFPRTPDAAAGRAAHLESYYERLATVVGRSEWERLSDAVVVDFGCGHGEGAVELAGRGARRVIGIDVRPEVLEDARRHARESGVADQCEFRSRLEDLTADVIVSVDAFEHFADPATVLEDMGRMLRPGGRVIASFGPTWYHPRGGHLFSVFPWSHLVFSEAALCRWRRDFRGDGAERFHEVEGGLNQMTIGRFERLVRDSPLEVERIRLRPISRLRGLHGRWTREFLTAVVDCVLVKPSACDPSLSEP